MLLKSTTAIGSDNLADPRRLDCIMKSYLLSAGVSPGTSLPVVWANAELAQFLVNTATATACQTHPCLNKTVIRTEAYHTVAPAQVKKKRDQVPHAAAEVEIVLRAVCATKLPTLTFDDTSRYVLRLCMPLWFPNQHAEHVCQVLLHTLGFFKSSNRC